MKVKTRRPDIFSYNDHLAFLKDWVAYLKATQSRFSLRSLAKLAGLASGYLPMVLNGTRPLSAAALAKMIPHLGLNANEQSFLESLLILGTSDSHDVRMMALERMKKFSQFRSNNEKETAAYQYLTHWYYVAIREMATLKDFNEDPEWIQQKLRFQVSLKEVKEALEFLFKYKFLERGKDGKILAPTEALNCQGGVYRVGLSHFHREIMRLAGEAIDKVPREERNIMGHTCSLSEKNYLKARAIAEEAIRKIQALTESEQGSETVYHMEVALFPLTQKKNGSKA
jgi:uncharacterized protein (TIGR02147 family)